MLCAFLYSKKYAYLKSLSIIIKILLKCFSVNRSLNLSKSVI
jgi:hypothetical protein